jgi:hypothetical protein
MMIPFATTGIRALLSSAVVGGIAVAIALFLLASAQVLTWRCGPRQSVLTRTVAVASALACVIAIVLIAARFLIID